MKIVFEQTGKEDLIKNMVDIIVEEFKHPFKDPRTYRTIDSKPEPLQLLYWLIDETERTFKPGIIVTATVVKDHERKLICKLDNGIDGIIEKDDIGSSNNERFEDFVNHVITGRIDRIESDKSHDDKFSVYLKCKREHLESHKEFVDKSKQYDERDLINHNF